MTKNDKALALVLRITGVWTLVAIGAVLMPTSWMASIHAWLGLGEFPAAPIVQNLARSVSAFYAIYGAVLLYLANDLERYRSLIRFLGVLTTLFGVALFGIDFSAGMPRWWTASESLATLVIGVLMFVLARQER